MKIINAPNTRVSFLDDIKTGECFWWNNILYMKCANTCSFYIVNVYTGDCLITSSCDWKHREIFKADCEVIVK